MTTSASTPRLRVTLLWYLCLLLLTAVTRSAPLPVLLRGALDLLALLTIVAACLGRVWCSVFIAGRKDAELVTNGPYALCRHPLYTLSLLGGVGLGLATHSFTLTIATLVVQGVLFSRAAREEERFMTARFDVRYADVDPKLLPATESLKETLARVLPFWETRIAPQLRAGRNVLVVAHGNSLRAMVKMLDDVSEADIVELNIPTGVPLLYELDATLKPLSHRYLGDAEAIAAAARLTDEPVLVRELEDMVRHTWDFLHVVPTDRSLLDEATTLATQQPIGVSSAMHLAAANRLPRPVRFVTFDPAQIPVALSLGFDVVSG